MQGTFGYNQAMQPISRTLLCFMIIILVAGCTTSPVELLESLTPTAVPSPTPTVLPSPTPEPDPYTLVGFERFLEQAAAARIVDRPRLVNDFMARLPSSPLVDGETVIFVYQGVGREVKLLSDLTSWQAEDAPLLERLPDTEFWYLVTSADTQARIDYVYLVDGVEMIDRFNGRSLLTNLGPRSELRMPGYVEPEVITLLKSGQANPPAGTLTTHALDSAALGQRRTVIVYTPAQPPESGPYPSVYFQDGSDYINLIDTPALLDLLIAREEIPPLVAVFIPPLDREVEYLRSDSYTAFLIDELVPFVRQTYGTSVAAERTAVVGASLGGLSALHAAQTHPEVFGRVGSQSGRITLDNQGVINTARLGNPLPLEIYLTVGQYETNVGPDPASADLAAAHAVLTSVLQSKGYTFRFEQYPQGHSWGFWEATLPEMLGVLFGEE